MISCRIDAPVAGDHLLNLRRWASRENIAKDIDKMPADTAAQKLVGDVGPAQIRQYALDRAADVRRGIDKRAINVEKVNGESGNRHYGQRSRHFPQAVPPTPLARNQRRSHFCQLHIFHLRQAAYRQRAHHTAILPHWDPAAHPVNFGSPK